MTRVKSFNISTGDVSWLVQEEQTKECAPTQVCAAASDYWDKTKVTTYTTNTFTSANIKRILMQWSKEGNASTFVQDYGLDKTAATSDDRFIKQSELASFSELGASTVGQKPVEVWVY